MISPRWEKSSESLRHWPEGTQPDKAGVGLKLLLLEAQTAQHWAVILSKQGRDRSRATQPGVRAWALTTLGPRPFCHGGNGERGLPGQPQEGGG